MTATQTALDRITRVPGVRGALVIKFEPIRIDAINVPYHFRAQQLCKVFNLGPGLEPHDQFIRNHLALGFFRRNWGGMDHPGRVLHSRAEDVQLRLFRIGQQKEIHIAQQFVQRFARRKIGKLRRHNVQRFRFDKNMPASHNRNLFQHCSQFGGPDIRAHLVRLPAQCVRRVYRGDAHDREEH